MKRLSSIRAFRIVLALAVAFWMAGAGCMLGCENMLNSLTSAEAKTIPHAANLIASGSACASMASHDCCAAHHQSGGSKATKKGIPGATQAGAVPTPMTDCPLAINATAALSKSRSEQRTSAISHKLENSSTTFGYVRPPESPRFLPPNRGHTYLRCCVFLI